MEYAVLQEDSIQKIKSLVEKYILNGWLPLGGIAYYNSTSAAYYNKIEVRFYQAMTRTTKIPSGKTKVVMLNDGKLEHSILKKGDECYIECVSPETNAIIFILVRLSDGEIDFASVFEIKAIAINDN